MTWHRALRYAARRAQRVSGLRWCQRDFSSARTAVPAIGAFSLASGLVRVGPVEGEHGCRFLESSSWEIGDVAWSKPPIAGLGEVSVLSESDGGEPKDRRGADGSASRTMSLALARLQEVSRGAQRGVVERWATVEGRMILQVIGTNVAVFALWKVLPASFMVRHFASSLEAMRRGRVWVTLTSNFSHQSLFHLACNMYLLDNFGRDVITILSPERFGVLYTAGGIASVLGSLATRRLMRNNVLSLGASGSVMATMFMFSNLFPERKLYILGMWEIKARDALVLWACFDAAGLLGSFGKIDFAAHLSGGLFSLAYYNFIREDLAREYANRQRGSWRIFGRSSDQRRNVKGQ